MEILISALVSFITSYILIKIHLIQIENDYIRRKEIEIIEFKENLDLIRKEVVEVVQASSLK